MIRTRFLVLVLGCPGTKTDPIIFTIRSNVEIFSKMISLRTYFRLYYSLISLFYASSLANPILYAFRIPEFRRALFSVLDCRSQPQSAQGFPLNQI